jgi:thioredoxin 1
MTDTAASTGAKHLSTDDFQQTLDQAGGKPVFVDFYAEWCGPCKLAAPIVDRLAGEFADQAVIAKVDVDEWNELAAKYGVMSIPTVIVFHQKDGQMVEAARQVGYNGEPGYRDLLAKVGVGTAKA